jgi:hypothetical protein
MPPREHGGHLLVRHHAQELDAIVEEVARTHLLEGCTLGPVAADDEVHVRVPPAHLWHHLHQQINALAPDEARHDHNVHTFVAIRVHVGRARLELSGVYGVRDRVYLPRLHEAAPHHVLSRRLRDADHGVGLPQRCTAQPVEQVVDQVVVDAVVGVLGVDDAVPHQGGEHDRLERHRADRVRVHDRDRLAHEDVAQVRQ